MSNSTELIVALDFPRAEDARELVCQLDDRVGSYKVGLELLTAAGPALISELVDTGKSVFLDLKLHEIPHSVGSAVRVCGQLGVSMVTVHATAGSAVMRAAVEAAAETPDLRVLALTVITSLTDESLAETGVSDGVSAHVDRLIKLARDAGCHGVVAAPGEVTLCKDLLPPEALIVVPGVSIASDMGAPGDHARSGTVAGALEDGATHVVLGRSISRATDPWQAVNQARGALANANE